MENQPSRTNMAKIYFRSDTRYNSNTFGVNSYDEILPVQQDSGIFPGTHDSYLVYNVGRSEVYAEVKYGTKVMWHGITDTAVIQPGEKKILNTFGALYYVTGLKIYNNTDTRAVVHCAVSDDTYYVYADREPGTFDDIKNKILKQIFVMGLKHVPYVGIGLSKLVEAFWPKNEPSVWEQIQDNVKVLLDEQILQIISAVLNGDLRYYQERITTLSEEIENGGSPDHLRAHYMNIAQDMIGFENKFKFTSDTSDYQDVNQYVLPHFSAFILMKVSFYVVGIREAKTLGLSEENVRNITKYANKTIYGDNGANKHINDLYQNRTENAYKSWCAEDLYDNMMNVRTYISTQGLEYINLWDYILQNPFSNKRKPYNDVISYSTFYGRQTAKLIQEATSVDLSQPLTPKLIHGKRNKVTFMDVYLCKTNGRKTPLKIGGTKISFDNGDCYKVGTETSKVHNVDFKDAVLDKLEVTGWGALESLTFHFSDGRVETCGNLDTSDHSTVFELKDHHIASIFMSSDNYSLGGQAANISVAYQLNSD